MGLLGGPQHRSTDFLAPNEIRIDEFVQLLAHILKVREYISTRLQDLRVMDAAIF